MIMVDTLRADYLGSYGFRGPISPNLDRLAAESVVFDRCYSQAPWTKPAIASLFTGLDPVVHRVLTHRGRFTDKTVAAESLETDVLPQAAVTLAETLQAVGYDTAAFISNPWIRKAHGFDQGFAHFDERFTGNDTPADVILDSARAWLTKRDDERPYFLYLHFMDVHDPYDAPDEDVAVVRGSESLTADRQIDRKQLPPGMMRAMLDKGLPWVQSESVLSMREWRTRYAAGVRAFDRRIGPFLDELRSSGALDAAVLIVVADHGEELYEHGDWAHGKNLHDHQLRIPLIVRLPGARDGGKRIDALTALMDVMPTVADLAGAAVPPAVQGKSLVPLLRGSTVEPLHTGVHATGVKWQPELHSLQTRELKLIKDIESGRAVLFDSLADPGEQKNLAPERSEEVSRLGDQLDSELAAWARHPGVGRATAPIDPQVEERLRALGYLE